MEDCKNCPLDASLAVASEFVETHPDFFNNKGQAASRGFVKAQTSVFESVKARLVCDGPQTSAAGMLVCHLEGASNDASASILGPNENGKKNFNFPVLNGEAPNTAEGPGQYL